MLFPGVDTTRVLVEGMKVAKLNHRIIANNVANADTPNFNPTELDFQATLRKALGGQGSLSLRRTHPLHLEGVARGPASSRLAWLSKNDYNKVDLDDQMAKLGENTGRYSTYAGLLVKRFGQVKDMLSGLR